MPKKYSTKAEDTKPLRQATESLIQSGSIFKNPLFIFISTLLLMGGIIALGITGGHIALVIAVSLRIAGSIAIALGGLGLLASLVSLFMLQKPIEKEVHPQNNNNESNIFDQIALRVKGFFRQIGVILYSIGMAFCDGLTALGQTITGDRYVSKQQEATNKKPILSFSVTTGMLPALAILGINEQVGQILLIDDVKKTYRKCILKAHPDRNKKENANELFDAINKAFEALMKLIKNDTQDDPLGIGAELDAYFDGMNDEIAALNKDFQEIRYNMNQYSERIDAFNQGAANYDSRVTQFSKDVSQLGSDVLQLGTDVSQLGSDVSQFGTDVSRYVARVDALDLQIDNNQETTRELKIQAAELMAMLGIDTTDVQLPSQATNRNSFMAPALTQHQDTLTSESTRSAIYGSSI